MSLDRFWSGREFLGQAFMGTLMRLIDVNLNGILNTHHVNRHFNAQNNLTYAYI